MKQRSGFTLIELIVVLAIAAILAAVAIPNYSAYVVRGKRAAAKTVLLEAAQWMERNYTANGCYNRTTAAECPPPQAGVDLVLPFTVAPREGRASYAIGFVAGTLASQAFTLQATRCTAGTCPAGSDLLTDAECANFVLDNLGQRTISGSGTVANCWQR